MENKAYNLAGTLVDLYTCEGVKEIHAAIETIIGSYEQELPQDKHAHILLKPNLNNDLIALTGCTTDLRIITGVLKALQKREYTNITIGDGPNSGAFHEKIDVHGRLGLKGIGEAFHVKIVDFNQEEGIEKPLGTRVTKISNTFLHADYIINLPKIKTHTEARYSGALKNLVGCNVGYDKRNVHWSLQELIVELNDLLKPNLHIMDGLVAMEGDGPGAGTPKKLGILLASKNPYVLDAFTSRLVGFSHKEVPSLVIAQKKNLLTLEHLNAIEKENILGTYSIKKPSKNRVVNLLLTNYFVLPRYWKVFDPLFATKVMNWALVKLYIRQDIYTHEEKSIELEKAIPHGNYKKEESYCPVELKLDDQNFKFDNRCIQCMYCFSAGTGKIKAKGNLGYFQDQINRYNKDFKREF